jgi:hypothetical protein
MRTPAIVALALGLVGCAKHASQSECAALLDHGVELAVRDHRPEASDDEIAAEKAKRRAEPAGRDALAACPNEVSKDAYACALAAPTIDEYERCLVEPPYGVR